MGPPALGAGIVLAGSRDGRLYGLDRKTGGLRWSFRTGGPVDCGAVVCGDMVVAGSDDGRLYGLALQDGRKLWSYDVGAPLSTGIAVSGDRILVGAGDGRIYAFGERSTPVPATAGSGRPRGR